MRYLLLLAVILLIGCNGKSNQEIDVTDKSNARDEAVKKELKALADEYSEGLFSKGETKMSSEEYDRRYNEIMKKHKQKNANEF